MKKTLVGLFTLIALAIGTQASQAVCCPSAKQFCKNCVSPQERCEIFLHPQAIEDYLCQIGMNECQKVQARIAIGQFKEETACLRANGFKCESKCECRAYRKALKNLDCAMKNIITKCQEEDYKTVKKDVKEQVKFCHKCLINPFTRCKCAYNCN